MAILTFPAAQIRALVEHSKAAKEHCAPFQKAAFPALVLVHDSGIYLMSSGRNQTETKPLVVYAIGYDPSKDEDYYQAARQAVGGDDFAEHLPLGAFEPALATGADHIDVRISARSITVNVRQPRRQAPSRKAAMTAQGFRKGLKVHVKGGGPLGPDGADGEIVRVNPRTIRVALTTGPCTGMHFACTPNLLTPLPS